MKALASHGATGEMSVVGRTTPSTRVEVSEERGDITYRGDQWRGNRSGGAYHGGSSIWNSDDNGNVVVECVRDLDSRGRLVGSDSVGGRDWRGWCLGLLLSSDIGDYSGGWGNLRTTSCLNQKRLKAMHDVRGNKFSEDVIATALKVLHCLF